MNQFSQLSKALELMNDQGLVVGLFFPKSMAPVIASVSVPRVRALVVVTAPETVLVPNPKLGPLNANIANLSTCGNSSSPSPTKRVQSDSSSIPIEGSSPKWARLMEDGERDALAPFFRLPAILPYRVPSTPKEFIVIVATENQDFFWVYL